jgi:hypothetical protein
MDRLRSGVRGIWAYVWERGRYFTQYAVNLVTGAIQARPPLPPPEAAEIERREDRPDEPPGDDGFEDEGEEAGRQAVDELDNPNRVHVVQHVRFRGLAGDPEGVRPHGDAIYSVRQGREFRDLGEIVGAIEDGVRMLEQEVVDLDRGEGRQGLQPDDRVQLLMFYDGPGGERDRRILPSRPQDWRAMRDGSWLRTSGFAAKMYDVLRSGEDNVDEISVRNIQLAFKIFRIPRPQRGAGVRTRPVHRLDRKVNKRGRGSWLTIKEDDMCVPRAIIIALHYPELRESLEGLENVAPLLAPLAEEGKGEEVESSEDDDDEGRRAKKPKPAKKAYNSVRDRQNTERLRDLAKGLCRASGVEVKGLHGGADLQLFANHLGARIVLIDKDRTWDKAALCIYNPEVPSNLTGSASIYLMASSTHVDAIRELTIINNIRGYQGYQSWCEDCWVGYQKEGEHHCRGVCSRCKSDECDTLDGALGHDEEDELRGVFMCMSCRKNGFKTEKCLELHALKCGDKEWCRTCGYEMVKDKEHKCWHARCNLCKTTHDSRAKDRCFIKKMPFKVASKQQRYVCADIETKPGIRAELQDLVAGWDGSAETKPAGLDAVVAQVCDHVTAVVIAGDLQSVDEDATFKQTGANCLISFFQWLEGQGHCTILCHNGAGFDFHFMHEVLMARYCFNDAGKAAKEIRVIDNAGRYLRMSFGDWTFLDSYSFIPEGPQQVLGDVRHRGDGQGLLPPLL